MDWQRFSQEFDHAETLSDEALTLHLQTLAADAPEVQAQLARYLRGRRRGFMQTSMDADEADDAETLPPGSRVNAWEIVALIGTGGMGEVYRAERCDGLYDQTVALKVMRPGTDKARFAQERQRLAQIDHAGVSRIIDGGLLEDKRPYLVMEFVRGEPIHTYAEARKLNTAERIRLILALCDALSYVHAQLILHRDIKASNVLVDTEGNVRLIDFGIAAVLGPEEDAQAGPFTLAYAAPEQLERAPLSMATDIFALGILLHLLLARALPLRQPDGSIKVALTDKAGKDLRAVVEKATARAPADRYASVTDLQTDLKAWLQRRPVAAREGGRLYRGGLFLRRHALANGLAAALVIALVTGIVTSTNFAREARAEAQRALLALEKSEFHLDTANTWMSSQSAYADVLQRLFGSEDVERQTQALMNVWREAHEAPNKSQEERVHAAYLSYSIGRHFMFRNDYPTALEIFSTWLEAGYGEETILVHGKHLLALTYAELGKHDLAEPMLREVEAWWARGHGQGMPDHVAVVTTLAGWTLDPADLKYAETLLLEATQMEESPAIRGYMFNQLGRMRQALKDFDGAYEAWRAMADILLSTTVMELSGQDTGLLNLAWSEIHLRQDLTRAEQLARGVIEQDAQQRGESRELGRALNVLGAIELLRGNPTRAEPILARALELMERFAGKTSTSYAEALASYIEVLAELGRFEQARSLLADMANHQSINGGSYSSNRIALANVYLEFKALGAPAAQSLCDQVSIPKSRFEINPALIFNWERLVAMGVVMDQCLTDDV